MGNKVLPNGALQSCRSILHRQFIIFDTAQVIFRCAKLGKPRNEWYPGKCSLLEQIRGNSQNSSNSFLSILVLSHFLGKLLYIIPTPRKINMKPNLKVTPFEKENNLPNLQLIVFQPWIFQGVYGVSKAELRGFWGEDSLAKPTTTLCFPTQDSSSSTWHSHLGHYWGKTMKSHRFSGVIIPRIHGTGIFNTNLP